MKLLFIFLGLLLTSAQSHQLLGPCSSDSCENGALCTQFNGSHHACECIDSRHFGLRCEHKKCDNGNTETPCETNEKCDGPNCSTSSEICERDQPCLNDGICSNTATSFICACPTGFSGVSCEIRDATSCSADSCVNGYCVGSECVCDAGWTGDRCDVDIDECALFPCAQGATCRNKNGSFECVCPEGRTGLRCESGTCKRDQECLNGGYCIEGECICQPGFAGPNCERKYVDPCLSSPCSSDKVCLRNQSEIFGYSCVCRPGYRGRFCDVPITNFYSKADKTDLDQCTRSGCSALAVNGVCNQECNHFACGFDGEDCSAGTLPWSSCPDASFCAQKWRDGKCDQLCNNEKCLFDGFDCIGPQPEIRKNGTMADIKLTIPVTPDFFKSRVDDFLHIFADRLRTTVIIKKTDGEMDVFEWTYKTGKGQRVSFGSRTDARVEYRSRAKRSVNNEEDLSGILVIIQVDLSECTKECFTDAYQVAAFIGALEAKEPGFSSVPIASAMVVPSDKEAGGSSSFLGGFLGGAALMLVLLGVVTVGLKKRHIVEAPIWGPPMESAYRAQKQIQSTTDWAVLENRYTHNTILTHPVFKAPPASIESTIAALPSLTPLEQAANGEERIHPEMRRFMQASGRYERTPLHWLALNTKKSSADIESDFNQLISFGVNVNAVDEDGNSALHYACENARPQLARKLLEAGADPSLGNEEDMTALHVAAKHFDERCMELLLAHKFYCKDTSNLELVDVEDRTALMLYAARSNRSIRGAQLLVKAGANVNYAGDKQHPHYYEGRTALHHAAIHNSINAEMIRFLTGDIRTNKDAQDTQEATPLWHAVNQQNRMAVDELLKAGASIDFADNNGKTPYDLAREKGFADIIERLEKENRKARILGMPQFPAVPTQMPVRNKRRKIEVAASSSSTTPSPPAGLMASTSSGPSCLDSPHSDQGRRSTGDVSDNSSSLIGSPIYTPAYTQQQPMQQQQQQHQQQQLSTFQQPSPPYDPYDPNGYYPTLTYPAHSYQQAPACAYSQENSVQYPQNHPQYPPACAYQSQL